MRAAVPKEIIDGILASDRLDQMGTREELFYDRRMLIAALFEARDQRDDAVRIVRELQEVIREYVAERAEQIKRAREANEELRK